MEVVNSCVCLEMAVTKNQKLRAFAQVTWQKFWEKMENRVYLDKYFALYSLKNNIFIAITSLFSRDKIFFWIKFNIYFIFSIL